MQSSIKLNSGGREQKREEWMDGGWGTKKQVELFQS